ncbi:hypothetical protein AB4305_14935 [Nocardia sp. 2YAB30]|uniref:hypothetical protein n=1 Tax=unclassified Nocardia TaxID=2637762 RepID=UPI003F9E8CBD
MTNDDTTTAPATTPTVPSVDCPIRVGDEVTPADRPDLRGTVTDVYRYHGTLQCCVRTPEGARVLTRPWHLLPADGASEQWHQQMRELLAAQRAHAADLLERRHHQLADRAEALAHRLAALATTLRHGHLPDLGDDPAEFDARELDADLDELHDLHTDLTTADLITGHD